MQRNTIQYRVADLQVDVGLAQVARAGNIIPLPKLTFDLLMALIEAAPAIASPDDLMTRVWPHVVVSPETISQRVKLLREALGDDSKQPRYVGVVRGRGYRLVADVERNDGAPAALPSRTSLNRGARRAGFVIAATLCVVLAVFLIETLKPHVPSTPTPVLGLSQGSSAPATDANTLFLQGASLSRHQEFDRAIQYFQQALALDPGLARAEQGIADARFVSGWIQNRRVAENVLLAERAARRALDLDPNLADAHNVLGGVAAARGDWLEMEASDRRALALGLDDAQVHLVRSDHLATVGRLRAALAEAQSAYSLAPADPQVVSKLAMAYSLAGDDALALKYAQTAVDLGAPSNGTADIDATQVRAALHDLRFADAAARELKALDPTDTDQARTIQVIELVYAALAGQRFKEDAVAARVRLYPRDELLTSNIAPCIHSSLAYAVLGTLDIAYDLANQCLNSAAPGAILATAFVSTLKWGPELRAFRKDVRFSAFVTRLGLMDYYLKFGPPDNCDLQSRRITCH